MLYQNTGVTIELGELLDSGFQLWGFDYPSYYEGEKKTAFEQKVVDHYRFRQIGQETPARFRHYFQTRLREVMPYYIQMYKLQEKVDEIEDPLESYNLTETYTQDKTGAGSIQGRTTDSTESNTTNTGESETTGQTGKDTTRNNTRKFSNTPQGSIQNLDDHLTEATIETGGDSEDLTAHEQVSNESTQHGTVTGSGTSETTTQDTENTQYTLTRKGNIGVQPLGSEIRDIRNSFINIDLMVIESLADLFLMVY